MGNCLISAYWNPVKDDWQIVNDLKSVAQNYGLSMDVDPNNPDFIPGKSTFSAEISGFWVSWNGGPQNCEKILKKVEQEWKNILEYRSAQEFQIKILYLPM